MSFPFSAVVGHADMRLALLLTAVDPGIGGVLVRGEKGTAKSTIVRALAALLPPVEIVAGDRFSVDADAGEESPDGPFAVDAPRERRPARLVELPVGASEDRLIGSLDLREVLGSGRAAVQPGLLAAAHRGVLYVDEVNLLHDHLVDLLLDAAASGRAHVERDGVSLTHPASFLLVGTMNPEEGELRPQLLDRFGLTVAVTASRDVRERTEVVRRRLGHDADPAGFGARFAPAEDELRAQLVTARARLGSVALPDTELVRISALCAEVDVDGMRADVVLARTAVAHAAWRGVDAVDESDVRAAARLALPHRRRRDPFDEPHLSEDELDEALRKADEAARDAEPPEPDPDGGGEQPPTDGDQPPGDGGAAEPSRAGASGSGGPNGTSPASGEASAPFASDGEPAGEDSGGDRSTDTDTERQQRDSADTPEPDGPGRAVGAPTPVRLRRRRFEVRGVGEGAPGRRSRARGELGRRVRATTPESGEGSGLHLPATVLAAARARRPRTGAGLALGSADLRRAVREGREGNLVLFCVDASGSMAARRRMNAVTGAVAALLRDAYQRRDKVGVISFRGQDAELVLPPTSSVHTAHARLADLRTGGRTPLGAGLRRARQALRVERTRDPRRRALLVLVTDGRATGGGGLDDALDAARGLARDAARGTAGAPALELVVVDCEAGPVRLGLAGRLAGVAGGTLVTLEELTGEALASQVTGFVGGGPRGRVA